MTRNTFFLDQHGCAKNQVDGELLISRLEKMGLSRVDNADDAELIIINSCGFIESAKQESLDAVLGARQAYPEAKILLAGCLAERYAENFRTELPEADGIFGNGDLSLIDGTVKDLLAGGRPVVRPPQKGVCCGDRNMLLSFKGSAYVKITEGCDNRCTFCAIPIIRGRLRSRPAADIVQEIQDLVARGVKEINLIGQDLAAYGCGTDDDVFNRNENWHGALYGGEPAPEGKKSPLKELMEQISSLEGNFWIRLLYIHPDHFNTDILSVMQKDTRFLPYFDIPFQSGDDAIIHAMNRRGSFARYSKLVQEIRNAFPDSCIRTTFLTGFPGETKEAAATTERFLKEIQSDWSGCFTYSQEEDTPAGAMKQTVSAVAAKRRADKLSRIQAEITAQRLQHRVGKTYDVLVEEIVENKAGTDEGLAIGRAWFEAPEVDGNVVIRYDLDDEKAVKAIVPGEIVKVHALAASEVDVDGEFCGD